MGLVLQDGQGAVQLLGVVDMRRAVMDLAKGVVLILQGLFALLLIGFIVVALSRSSDGQEQERRYQQAARGCPELHYDRSEEACGCRSFVVGVFARDVSSKCTLREGFLWRALEQAGTVPCRASHPI